MAMKKTFLTLAFAGMLGGCAASGDRAGVQIQDLQKPSNLIAEQLIADMDFPALQRNLFKHRAECGSAPRFAMDKGETGHASLIETAELPDSYENVVVADLTQYPESWRSSARVAVSVYSYYNNAEVRQRAERMLDAVRRPGNCAPEQTAG